MTEYCVHKIRGSVRIESWRHKNLKDAENNFRRLSEEFPKEKFKIVRKVTTEEVICESEDVRQARFDFV